MQTYDLFRRSEKPPSQKELLKAVREHIKSTRTVTMFSDTGKDAKEKRIARAENDPSFFHETYLPHFFKDEPAEWHPEFIEDLQITDQMLAVTAERGGAKSTILFAEILRWICYRKHKLLVYRLDSFEKAEYYTERILIEFQHNARLRHDFGQMVTSNAARSDFSCFDPTSKRTITRIVAMGTNMSLRGFINEDTRPDVIISEDLQDRDSAESEKRTTKELRRLMRDARPALTPTGWKFIVVGNIICSGSLMDELLDPEKNKAFVKRRYPSEYIDEKGQRCSSWKARFPLELLDKIKWEIGDDAYEVEFLCRAVEVGSVFKPKRDFHRYRELPVEIDLRGRILVQVDPALSGTNDYTAIGVFTTYTHDINRPDYNRWSDIDGIPFGEGVYTILLDVYCRKVGIDETIQASYDFYDRWRATDFHCDGSVDKEIVFDRFFSQYESATGKRLPIVFDKFLTSKDARIKALQPLMQRKRVLLPPGTSEDIENLIKQLSRYGKTNEHDDAPDMLAAGVENCDPQYGMGRIEVYVL
jgi:predicted phage terminase large subunit-like protein